MAGLHHIKNVFNCWTAWDLVQEASKQASTHKSKHPPENSRR